MRPFRLKMKVHYPYHAVKARRTPVCGLATEKNACRLRRLRFLGSPFQAGWGWEQAYGQNSFLAAFFSSG
jgi:hypothetical protein